MSANDDLGCVSGKLEMPVKGGELCVVCETAMGELKSILDDPNNEKTIEQILDEVCNLVPASDKGLVSAVLLTLSREGEYSEKEMERCLEVVVIIAPAGLM